MEALRDCERQGGTRCRIDRIYNSNRDRPPLPKIEELLARSFWEGSVEDTQFLLDQGSRISAYVAGAPVLHRVVQHGGPYGPALLKLMLTHQTDKRKLNLVDRKGNTALHVAVQSGTEFAAIELLAAGG